MDRRFLFAFNIFYSFYFVYIVFISMQIKENNIKNSLLKK